jgi:prepilin-type N-terminal cleavage/methylation domain-containing protein
MCDRGCAGFTLIELSIVLVIIGLIAGGILVGRDLIKAAEIRQEVSRLSSYETAFHTFRLKYDGVPGDFNQPGIIDGVTAGHYGDGNGIVDDFFNGNQLNDPNEGAYAWEHLSKAQLIDGNFNGTFGGGFKCLAGVTCPQTSFNQTAVPFLGFAFSSHAYQSLYGSSLTASITNTIIMLLNGSNLAATTGILTVDQAYAIDAKLDDGVAYSGRVLTINPALAAIGCIDGSPRDKPLDFTTHTYSYNLATDTADNCEIVYGMR